MIDLYEVGPWGLVQTRLYYLASESFVGALWLAVPYTNFGSGLAFRNCSKSDYRRDICMVLHGSMMCYRIYCIVVNHREFPRDLRVPVRMIAPDYWHG